MEKYFKKQSPPAHSSVSSTPSISNDIEVSCPERPRKKFQLEDLIPDHGIRPPTSNEKGPCQSRSRDFEQYRIGSKYGRFVPDWLCASIDCIRFLLCQDIAFCGRDESDDSLNRGNFLELMEFLTRHNETINKLVLDNASEILKWASPNIQKDIVRAIVSETTGKIIKDIGDDMFTVLIDESYDTSMEEQMVIILRYVNIKGEIIEHLLGIVHVPDTTSSSLKAVLDSLFARFGLNIAKVRGQSYNGTSNMKGEFNGLKALIMKENKCAYYVHCFAHQLQLILVAIAQRHHEICELFSTLSAVMDIVEDSSQRQNILEETEINSIIKGLDCGELKSRQGLNQEFGIKRTCDLRWGSHYGLLLNLTLMFPSIINLLNNVKEDMGLNYLQRGHASTCAKALQTFDFIFLLHLMKNILLKTNDLSQALQRNDQDIVNAMNLVKLTKILLNRMRNDESEWQSFLEDVYSFCTKYKIEAPNMDDFYKDPSRSRRKKEAITNLHWFQCGIYNNVVDWVLAELNECFNEVNTELLLCVACLDPADKFASFDKQKLIRLAELYPNDFSLFDCCLLDSQLDLYIMDMQSSPAFTNVKGLDGLAKKLVELKKHRIYPLVYLLLKLALLLPVATATVERVLSAMKIIRNRLCNEMGDELLNDCLVAYIERDVTATIENERIIERFQNMYTHKIAL